MNQGLPTDAAVAREPDGPEIGRQALLCVLERACYSEDTFLAATGFHPREREALPGGAGEVRTGVLRGRPTALLIFEPGCDTNGAARSCLHRLARQTNAALVVAGVALPLDRTLTEGQLVLLSDHINLLGEHPLAEPHDSVSGGLFPDMTRAYDERLLDLAEAGARHAGVLPTRGVCLACSEASGSDEELLRAAKVTGARVQSSGIVPFVLAAAALRVPALAAVLVRKTSPAGHHLAPRASDKAEWELSKSSLAHVLGRVLCGVPAETRVGVAQREE